MRISSLIWILHLMNLTKGLDDTRRSSSMNRLCPAGCATCSALNGCLSCKPRLFFHLELDGMRQRGTCLSSCPRGHYGTRSPHISTCTTEEVSFTGCAQCQDGEKPSRLINSTTGCKEDCASCFSENFCTHCHPGHFLFRGKCENSCPNGLTPNAVLRECTECSPGCEVCVRRNVCMRCRADLYFLHSQCHLTCPTVFEPDVQLMQCVPRVHCEVGGWTAWGPCVRKKRKGAYRRGQETRIRQVLQSPSVHGNPCPHVSEARKCVIKKRPKSQRRL